MRAYKAFPILTVRDLDEALRYYREQLGFTVAWTWGTPPDRAGIALDEVELQLVAGTPVTPSVVYCHVHGVDEYHAACRARGASIAMELGPRPWGVRDFRVVDPSGNRLGFAEVDGAGESAG